MSVLPLNFKLEILVFCYFHSCSEQISSSEVLLSYFETTALFVLCTNVFC